MKQVQWFPGHMKKTLEEIDSTIKLVDIVWELRDARIPLSSKNPELGKILQQKQHMLVLTKKDLADPTLTKRWLSYFAEIGQPMVVLDLQHDRVDKLLSMSEALLRDKFRRDAARGMKKRPVKAMIVGVPNVGKSTLINAVSHKKVAAVGNIPGITKAGQWIRLRKDLDLLDTPGVLQPKFTDPLFGMRLAAIGTIKDTILPLADVTNYVMDTLREYYPGAMSKRFVQQIDIDWEKQSNEKIMEDIGRKRGLYQKNDVIDINSVIMLILQEFRSGKLGRITLDRDIPELVEGE